MQNVPVDSLVNKMGSIYKLVVLASLRAVELGEGAARLVDSNAEAKSTNIALMEIMQGKITFKEKEKK